MAVCVVNIRKTEGFECFHFVMFFDTPREAGGGPQKVCAHCSKKRICEGCGEERDLAEFDHERVHGATKVQDLHGSDAGARPRA